MYLSCPNHVMNILLFKLKEVHIDAFLYHIKIQFLQLNSYMYLLCLNHVNEDESECFN